MLRVVRHCRECTQQAMYRYRYVIFGDALLVNDVYVAPVKHELLRVNYKSDVA